MSEFTACPVLDGGGDATEITNGASWARNTLLADCLGFYGDRSRLGGLSGSRADFHHMALPYHDGGGKHRSGRNSHPAEHSR
jgi:hypothetical protein